MTQTTPASSPLDPYRTTVEHQLGEGRSYQEIANTVSGLGLATTRHSVRRAVKRWGLTRPAARERAGLKQNGDNAEIVSEPSTELITPDTLLKQYGLDPAEWEEDGITINRWNAMTSDKASGDNRIVEMKQVKVHFKRIASVNWVYPARIPGEYRRPIKLTITTGSKPIRRIVFVGDQQAPYHDKHLHQLFLEWLEHNKPDEGVLIGDTVDFPDISRHKDNPEWHVSAQECVDSGYELLLDYVLANEATDWTKLLGNHDERIRSRLLGFQTKLYGLRRAKVKGQPPEESVFHISNLLRLDELGIGIVDPGGNYDQGQYKLSPHLAARHGWHTKKGSGASALATLEQLGYSVVVGHTHRQGIVHKTTHDIDGNPSTLAAVETGCMCRIEGGLGYAVAPDWQAGFATATVWDDGKFKLDLATYVNNKLYYRDQRYS